MAEDLANKMHPQHRPSALGMDLSARQTQHTLKEIAVLAVATILALVIWYTHDPEFEPPTILLAKSLLFIALFWAFILEAAWM